MNLPDVPPGLEDPHDYARFQLMEWEATKDLDRDPELTIHELMMDYEINCNKCNYCPSTSNGNDCKCL